MHNIGRLLSSLSALPPKAVVLPTPFEPSGPHGFDFRFVDEAVIADRVRSLRSDFAFLSTPAVEHASARQTVYVRYSSDCGHVAQKTALPARNLALESAN